MKWLWVVSRGDVSIQVDCRAARQFEDGFRGGLRAYTGQYEVNLLASSLKARLRAGEPSFGAFLSFDFWPGYLEIFQAEGMHFAVLDMEHGSATLPQAEELCRVARLIDFPLLLRPESSLFHTMKKYLDMGPAGLMIPWVEEEVQVRTVLDSMFTPPRGRRGPGGNAIFHNRTLDRAGWDGIEPNLFLMPQIETPRGVANSKLIASPEGVDALMLGPYDLSLNMGLCWQPEHPSLVDAIVNVRLSAAEAGKPCGMVVGTVEQAGLWMDRGFNFFICSEVTSMVRTQTHVLVQGMRDAADSRRSGASKP
ncbi:MAG: hypothetical protein JSU00_08800 [Acidobacteria bacterium]|nr:hypothetical protein [Acidobacteriota bacterium]